MWNSNTNTIVIKFKFDLIWFEFAYSVSLLISIHFTRLPLDCSENYISSHPYRDRYSCHFETRSISIKLKWCIVKLKTVELKIEFCLPILWDLLKISMCICHSAWRSVIIVPFQSMQSVGLIMITWWWCNANMSIRLWKKYTSQQPHLLSLVSGSSDHFSQSTLVEELLLFLTLNLLER